MEDFIQSGLVEAAFLGGIAWIIIYTIYVFMMTAIYAMLTCASGFASYFIAVNADTSQAEVIFQMGQLPISTIEIVCLLMLFAAGNFFLRFISAFRGALSSYLRPITG